MPPTLTVCDTDSLGEPIQRALPKARVVKTLNTMNTNVMIDPRLVPGDSDVFVSGNINFHIARP
jgi:predicted dinucleotide-binding enzyme